MQPTSVAGAGEHLRHPPFAEAVQSLLTDKNERNTAAAVLLVLSIGIRRLFDIVVGKRNAARAQIRSCLRAVRAPGGCVHHDRSFRRCRDRAVDRFTIRR